MNEQEPASPPEPIPLESARRRRQGKRGSARWDIAGVAQQLRTEATPIEDALLGAGSRLLIGMTSTPVLALELYPQAAASRIRVEGVLLELSGIAPPAPAKEPMASDAESVLLQGGPAANDLRIGLSAEGEVSLFVAPHLALKLAPMDSEMAARKVVSESAPAGDSPAEKPDAAEARGERGEDQRVTVTGRAGADPQFRTTPKGVLIGSFPLAERQAEDVTIWHRVLAFGDRAENLQGAVKKGQAVQVIGYVHEREAPGSDGQPKIIREIYAAAVRDPKGPSQ